MVKITSKQDVHQWIEQFSAFSSVDAIGKKRYFVFDDKVRGGRLTLMRYLDEQWTLHGVGDDYCEQAETPMTIEHVCDLVWKHRSAINRAMKSLVTA